MKCSCGAPATHLAELSRPDRPEQRRYVCDAKGCMPKGDGWKTYTLIEKGVR